MNKANKAAAIPASSLEYRPKTYFGQLDLEAQLLTSVKGSARREIIKKALDDGEINSLAKGLKQAELEESDRAFIGRIHPMFMGGEFLPPIKPKEIEIARITLGSVTSDVAVMYARRVGNRIHYRVVNEYWDEDNDEDDERVTKRTSIKPLTMGQMIKFFMKAWNLFDILAMNQEYGAFEGDPLLLYCFYRAESEFYPYFADALEQQVMELFPIDKKYFE